MVHQFVDSDIFVEKLNILDFLTLIRLHSLCENFNQSNLSLVLESGGNSK